MWNRSILNPEVIDLEMLSNQHIDIMWTEVRSKEARNALVQEYLINRNHLRQRFQDEKLGEASLQVEATKLFKPVTTAVGTSDKQLQKDSDALERLPAQIAAEADYNLIAALFDEDKKALPAHPAKPTLFVDPDMGLDTDLIEQHGFMPPSQLDLSDSSRLKEIAEQVSHYNRHTLGLKKKKKKAAT